MLFCALVLAELISRKIIAPFGRLTAITHELPFRLEKATDEVTWPESSVEEAHHLINNFRAMAVSLSNQFSRIWQINESLEQRVEERTEKLRVSKEKHRSILRSAMDGFWIADMEGKLLEVNEAYCSMSGYSELELLSMRISDLQELESPDGVAARIRKIKERGVDRFLSRHRRKDGTCFDVEVSVKYQPHDGGINVAFLRDITSRKQVEDDLLESENRFRMMVETVPLAIRLTTGVNQITEYVNPEFTRLFGYTLDDIPDIEQWWLLSYPDAMYRNKVREEWSKVSTHAMETLSAIAPYETVVTCKDGSNKTIAWGVFSTGKKSFSYGLDLTEQKLLENTLRASERRFKNIVKEVPLGIHLYELSEDGHLLFCAANPAADRILGLDHSSLVGRTMEEAFPLFVATPAPTKYRETALFGIVWRKETVVCGDGKVYEFTSFQTEPGRMATMFDDITLHRQAEVTLLESEKRYRLLADNVSDIIWTMDLKGEFTYFSPSIEKLTGYSTDEVMQQSLNEILAPDSCAIATEAINNAITNVQAGLPVVFLSELEEYRKDGSTFWTEVSANAMYNKHGICEGFLGVTRDITLRKHQENALRKSEYEFRMLAESMPQIVWICSADGMGIYFNQKWVDYTGQALEASYGHGWNRPFHPDDLEIAWGSWQSAIKNGIAYTHEFRLRRADGFYKWFLIRAEPVRDERGTILKWFGTCTNIDNLKKSEEELSQAIIIAESANHAKSQFLANMSHEIRTPMNAVIGLTFLLLGTELDKTQREYVELIKVAGNNLQRLINNILDLSKIEENKIELENRPFDLHMEIADTLEIMSVQSRKKGLELKSYIDSSVPLHVRGDSDRLRQIIINLIDNAIKFTPTGSVSLKIHQEHADENITVLRFSVTDSGIGLPDEKLKCIFDPFVQADDSTTRKYGGTGLGLTISQQLVEMMGGKIGVESRGGEGATFWFTVQLEKQSEFETCPPERRTNSLTKINPVVTMLGGHHILLVEDDPINRLVTERFLKMAGVSADSANNGIEALRLLSENDYHLVLMDCQMPEMDGFKATQVIRNPVSQVRNHSVPVIALTANVLQGNQERCLAAGMNDFLSKPLGFDSLVEVLCKWIPGLPKSDTSIFDEVDLLRHHKGDVAFIKDIIQLFVAKAPQYVALLQENIVADNFPGVLSQAHKLKGAATALGANKLAFRAAELEELCERGEFDKTNKAMQQLTHEFECLLTVLAERGWVAS